MSQGRRLRTHSPYTPPSVSDRDRDPHVAVRRSLPLHVSWRGASAAWSPADSSGCTSTARGACRSIGTGCSGGGLCGSGWSRRSACGSAAAEAVSAPGCSGCSGSRMSAAWLMWRSGIRSRVRGGRTGSSPNSRTIFQSETLPNIVGSLLTIATVLFGVWRMVNAMSVRIDTMSVRIDRLHEVITSLSERVAKIEGRLFNPYSMDEAQTREQKD